MKHFEEHTLELYVLGAKEASQLRTEIEAHLAECEGCRNTVEEMRRFHSELADEMEQIPQESKVSGTAMTRRVSDFASLYEPNLPPARYMPRTPMQKVRYFIVRHPIAASIGGFSMAAMLVMAGMMIQNPFKKSGAEIPVDTNPAYKSYNLTTETVEIFNKDNVLLWQWKVQGLKAQEEGEQYRKITKTIITDIDQDGRNEVLTTLPLLGNENVHGAHLRIYDWQKKLIVDKEFNETVLYLNRSYSPYFHADAILTGDFDHNGKNEILVTANNLGRSPSVLYRLDDKGNVLGKFWHFGELSTMTAKDIDHDGNQEIIIGGFDDTNDTLANYYSQSFLSVLNPAQITGNKRSTVCTKFSFEQSDAESFYLLFPFSDLNNIAHVGAYLYNVNDEDSTTFNIGLRTVYEGKFFDFAYMISYQLHVLQVKSNNGTDAVYKALVDKKLLTGKIDAAYLDNLKNGVRYWDGKEWRKEVVKVQHPANLP